MSREGMNEPRRDEPVVQVSLFVDMPMLGSSNVKKDRSLLRAVSSLLLRQGKPISVTKQKGGKGQIGRIDKSVTSSFVRRAI